MHRRRARLLVAAGALVVGCSSGGDGQQSTVEQTGSTTTATAIEATTTEPGSESTTGQAVTSLRLLDAGSAPLVVLDAVAVSAVEIDVEASDASSFTVDGATTEEEATARYRLRVDANGGGSPSLVIVHDIQELVLDQPQPLPESLDAWRFDLDEHGIVRFIARGTTVGLTREAASLLTPPSLRLPTPTEPVGVGARWAYPLDASGEMAATVTLGDITDTDLMATVEFTATNDDGSISMIASGTYDRATLLAVDVNVTSVLVVDTEATVNEQVTTMTGTETSTRSYVRGS